MKTKAEKQVQHNVYLIVRVNSVGQVSICTSARGKDAAYEGLKYWSEFYEEEIEAGRYTVAIYKAI